MQKRSKMCVGQTLSGWTNTVSYRWFDFKFVFIIVTPRQHAKCDTKLNRWYLEDPASEGMLQLAAALLLYSEAVHIEKVPDPPPMNWADPDTIEAVLAGGRSPMSR